MLDDCDLERAAVDPSLLALSHRQAFVLNGSIAHHEQLFEGLSEALDFNGPAMIRIHAPSPGRHGFAAVDWHFAMDAGGPSAFVYQDADGDEQYDEGSDNVILGTAGATGPFTNYAGEVATDGTGQPRQVERVVVRQKPREPVPTSPDQLESGFNYLIEEPQPKRSFEFFKAKTGKGAKGLCISTSYPKKIIEEYGLHGTTVYWLSELEFDR